MVDSTSGQGRLRAVMDSQEAGVANPGSSLQLLSIPEKKGPPAGLTGELRLVRGLTVFNHRQVLVYLFQRGVDKCAGGCHHISHGHLPAWLVFAGGQMHQRGLTTAPMGLFPKQHPNKSNLR